MTLVSWISPKTEKGRPSPIHKLGFFAEKDISAGELVAVKAGHIIDCETLEENRRVIKDSQLQIADGLYLAPLIEEEFEGSMIYFNHSCEPNLGIDGQIAFVALRDIQGGEELTVDYGTIYADDFKMRCACGSPSCRQAVTGEDWRIPELQQKYGQHFAWFILQKLA